MNITRTEAPGNVCKAAALMRLSSDARSALSPAFTGITSCCFPASAPETTSADSTPSIVRMASVNSVTRRSSSRSGARASGLGLVEAQEITARTQAPRANLRMPVAALLTMALLFAANLAYAGEAAGIRLDLRGISLSQLADEVKRITGNSFIYKEDLTRQKVFMEATRELTKDEVMPLFVEICRSWGYAIIPTAVKGVYSIDKTDEALKKGTPEAMPQEQGAAGFALLIYRSPALDTEGLLEAAKQYVGVFGEVQQAGKGTLIIKAPPDKIPSIKQFLSSVEQSSPQDIYRIFRPRNFLPSKLVSLAKGVTGGDRSSGKVASLQPDDGAGILLVTGPPQAVESTIAILTELDGTRETGVRQIRYYRIKNTDVVSIARKVSILAGVPMVDGSSQSTPGTSSGTTAAAPVSTTSSQTQTGSDGASPLILADSAMNTLVVVGPENLHAKVEALLVDLDKRRAQVLIEAAIVQLTTSRGVDAGGEILFKGSAGDKSIEGGIGHGVGTQSNTSTVGLPDSLSAKAVDGGMLRVVETNIFQAMFSALATNSDMHVMARPLLLVNDNEEAQFSTRSESPTTTTSVGTATTNVSFQGYAQATTLLKITPHVSEDRYLVLDIEQKFEEFGTSSGVAGIPPSKVSHEVTTNVTVPDRATIIIGGFVRESEERTLRKVPFLGDIPLIGLLFRHYNKTVKYSRMYLFVRPHILDQADFGDLVDVSEKKSKELAPKEEGDPRRRPKGEGATYSPMGEDTPVRPPKPVKKEESQWSAPAPVPQ